MIRQIQDLRDAPVIRLQSHHFRSRMPLRETENMLHLCPPPRVDALRIIPHRHDLVMPTPDRIDKVGLQPIGVLILIH